MVGFAPATGARAETVLLLEDDEDLSELFEATLAMEGYAVDVVRDGIEALAYLAESRPDLIVSDIMMPGMDGLTFLARLREDAALRHLPVIMLTTKAAMKDIEAGFSLGADDYLAKPVNPRELLARVRSKIDRPPVPAASLRQDRQTGALNEAAFAEAMDAELRRAARGGYVCTLARFQIYEIGWLRDRMGPRVEAALSLALARVFAAAMQPLHILGRADDGAFLLFLPDTSAPEAKPLLEAISRRIVRSGFPADGETLRVTPLCGFAVSEAALSPADLMRRASLALAHANEHLDLRPIGFEPAMIVSHTVAGRPFDRLRAAVEPYRLAWQIAATYVLGWVIPFAVYEALYQAGLDVSGYVYLVLVTVLGLTAALIWVEGVLALKRRDPPELPDEAFGPVSAIIAAYLPNEAATLETTIAAFLAVDYPAGTQIILAYNTPADMPIEARFRELARLDPRFVPLRVEGSTSKAQNVNAALSLVTGAVVAVFDADHQPDRDSFRRAWRWIASGSDVVQGHCLIRNGEASLVARTVAVEFEMIYGVSHPGRARLHGFGIFGGSNGFWRTDLLREIRMRGSMLTEDIDSALRAVEDGRTITSDPYLISRELAPTTLRTLTHQRLRWAQGWYQVAMTRFRSAVRAPNLSLRQKLGMFHLLVWREAFPWVSMQIVPIIAFQIAKAGSVAALDWTIPVFVWMTFFVTLTGPGQVLFAWRNADPELRKRPGWFWSFLIVSVLFYGGYKNVLARVANLKEWLGERAWKVTPRG